jgi:hypothetical protein
VFYLSGYGRTPHLPTAQSVEPFVEIRGWRDRRVLSVRVSV